MAGSDAGTSKLDSSAERRGFAQLHRDLWLVVRTAPVVFVLVPVILWLPCDALIGSIAEARPAGSWERFRLLFQLSAGAAAVLGTLVSALDLAALIDLSEGEWPATGRCLREGLRLWRRIIAVGIAAALRIGVGMLLLVVPGIVLMVRYALAQPVAAFERLRPREALRASRACVRRGPGSVVSWILGTTLLYLPILVVPGFLVPGGAAGWVKALAYVPGNVFFSSFLSVGLTLLYADLREEGRLVPPVGSRWEPRVAPREWKASSGRRSVLLGLCVSGATLAAGAIAFYSMTVVPVRNGDEAREHGAYRDALADYERAAYWDPGDAYAHYRIGGCQQALDQFEEALAAFDTAIELEPGNLGYRLDRARLLVQMGRLKEARDALATARDTGAEEGVVVELEALLAERLLRENRMDQEAEAARSEELLRAIREEQEALRAVRAEPAGSPPDGE